MGKGGAASSCTGGRAFLRHGKIPLWVKLLYTLWVAALVPEYWQASPVSLLWFCNVALLVTLAALWLENSLLASMQWVVFSLSYALTQRPDGATGNLNQVYGLSEGEPQTWIAPWLWLALVMVAWPACVYVPSHLVFRRIFGPPGMATTARTIMSP